MGHGIHGCGQHCPGRRAAVGGQLSAQSDPGRTLARRRCPRHLAGNVLRCRKLLHHWWPGAGGGLTGCGRRHLRHCIRCASGHSRRLCWRRACVGHCRWRNLYRGRTFVGSGKTHSRRLLRHLPSELAFILPLDQCGPRIPGCLERHAGCFSHPWHFRFLDGTAGNVPDRAAGGGAVGWRSLVCPRHGRQRSTRIAPRPRGAGCSLRCGRGCTRSGRSLPCRRTPSCSVHGSGWRVSRCGPRSCRSMASPGAFGTGSLAHHTSGLAKRKNASRKADLPHRGPHLGLFARCQRPPDGARAARLGAGSADHQRLRQAGRGPALLLAPAVSRRTARCGFGPHHCGRGYGRVR